MTISATASALSTIDELILRGYKRAGLIPLDFAIGGDVQWNAKAEHGRSTMNSLLNHIAVEGFLDHFTTFFVLDLIAGQPNYAIDPDDNILNFVDYGSHIPDANGTEELETTGETQVQPISRHRWNSLSSKVATSSTPSLYYLDRNGPDLTVYIWPTPTLTSKIRFQVHRIPGSSSTGSNTPDVQRHWDIWLINALAYEFMVDSKLPLEERIAVREDRDYQMARIKAYETSNEAPDVIFMHSTAWSSRCY